MNLWSFRSSDGSVIVGDGNLMNEELIEIQEIENHIFQDLDERYEIWLREIPNVNQRYRKVLKSMLKKNEKAFREKLSKKNHTNRIIIRKIHLSMKKYIL